MFFYGHPQNRFWRVVSALYGDPFPETVPERRAFLLKNRIAVWDVIRSCEITGSSDASIRSAEVNFGVRADRSDLCQRKNRGEALSKVYGADLWKTCDLPSIHEPCKRGLDFGQADRCLECDPSGREE